MWVIKTRNCEHLETLLFLCTYQQINNLETLFNAACLNLIIILIFNLKNFICLSHLYPKLHLVRLTNRGLCVKKRQKKKGLFLQINYRDVDFDPQEFCRRTTLSHFSVSKDINLFEICI